MYLYISYIFGTHKINKCRIAYHLNSIVDITLVSNVTGAYLNSVLDFISFHTIQLLSYITNKYKIILKYISKINNHILRHIF